jgi:hypothetical protein
MNRNLDINSVVVIRAARGSATVGTEPMVDGEISRENPLMNRKNIMSVHDACVFSCKNLTVGLTLNDERNTGRI